MRCLYKDTWDGYCCITVSTTIMKNNEQIEKVYGTHLGNRSDSDIKCLSLHYSKILHLTNSFYIAFENMKNLVIFSSNLTKLSSTNFDGANELESITITNNILSAIYGYTFSNAKSLQTLDLKMNSISILDRDAFKELRNLTTLDLSFNQIKIVYRKTFIDLKSLRKLSLSYNQLTFVNMDLLRFNLYLEEVYLGGNKIASIYPNSFVKLIFLDVLFLESNICIDKTFKDGLQKQLDVALKSCKSQKKQDK